MKSEKRMVGDYTVLCAVNIGSREIILAENEQSTNGERFLCCYGERNDIFEKFTECAVGDDYGMTERYNIECCVPDFTEALFRECFPQRLVGKAFALLTPIQQSRVKQHIFGKKSFAKIAASEGKAKNTVQESYDAAIKKMKKFLKNTLPKDTPYSE